MISMMKIFISYGAFNEVVYLYDELKKIMQKDLMMIQKILVNIKMHLIFSNRI